MSMVKQPSQAFDLSIQFGDTALERLAAGTSEFVHPGKIAEGWASSRASEKITPRRWLTR
jgi:hypothetical protein